MEHKTCFDVLLTLHLSIFISVINQLDAQNFCFAISLFHACTCFEHMCSKHVEAWNKLIVKQKFCASSWLITEINISTMSHSKIDTMTASNVSSTCAHHQEVKTVLHSFWYHHTYRWPSGSQVQRRLLSQPVHQTATYRCDDTRSCVIQFWPPDDEHMCSKHVEAWNKLIVKQKFWASSWLITEINKICCLFFITTFVWSISHCTKNSVRYDHKCTLVFI